MNISQITGPGTPQSFTIQRRSKHFGPNELDVQFWEYKKRRYPRKLKKKMKKHGAHFWKNCVAWIPDIELFNKRLSFTK